MTTIARAHIGTSGWHYKHWVGPFYPEKMPPRKFLGFYAERFDTVEVNSTFYGLKSTDALEAWRAATPPGFVFACKASRWITHLKKLANAGPALEDFQKLVGTLNGKLGPLLFQTPPFLGVDAERLKDFLALRPAGQRWAFEFRSPEWFRDDIFQLLADSGASLCVYDFDGRQSPFLRTTDWIYVRLHGPGARYRGSYGEGLSAWADRLLAWMEEGADVYCYFDNDEAAHAAHDALRIRDLLPGR